MCVGNRERGTRARVCERERECGGKKGKRRLLNGRTRCETSRRVATFGCFSPFLLLLLFHLLRKICFHVDATVGGSDTAGRISGGRFRVRAEKKGSIFLAFPRRFRRRAEQRSSPSSKPSEAVFCWKQVGSAESRPCVRPAGGAGGGGGGRGRCPRPVFFPQAPHPLPILSPPRAAFPFFSLPPRCSRLDFSPFGLSSGELAVRT